MEKATCMNGLVLLVIKELRLERGIHSASIAEKVGKTPSAWAKIEAGKSSFSMDSLFQAAQALWIPASNIISAAERYSGLLGQNGWAVLYSSQNAEDDDLLTQAQKYYSTPGFKRRLQLPNSFNLFGISVLNSPVFHLNGSIQLVDVFRFVLDDCFRAEQEVG